MRDHGSNHLPVVMLGVTGDSAGGEVGGPAGGCGSVASITASPMAWLNQQSGPLNGSVCLSLTAQARPLNY